MKIGSVGMLLRSMRALALTTSNLGDRLSLAAKKGRIMEGADGDLCILADHLPWVRYSAKND